MIAVGGIRVLVRLCAGVGIEGIDWGTDCTLINHHKQKCAHVLFDPYPMPRKEIFECIKGSVGQIAIERRVRSGRRIEWRSMAERLVSNWVQ